MHNQSTDSVSPRHTDGDPTGQRGRHGREVDVSGSARVVSIYAVYPRYRCLARALEVFRAVVDRVRGGHFGLLCARVDRSLDGKALPTHAEWKSKSQHEAVLRDDEFVRRFNQLRELGIYESHVYEMTDDIYAIAPEIDRT
jgi:hypothetical protein